MQRIAGFLFVCIVPLLSQKVCPDGSIPFDFQTCDPNGRSQCPAGFTCRNSTNNSTGTLLNLCCESGRMSVRDWFTEKRIIPDILPQAPYSLLQTVQLSPASQILNFPPIHTGDEVVVLSFPNYMTGTIQSISLGAQINPGYVHVVTVIDPLFQPFAVLMNYNVIVGQPAQTINVTSNGQFVAYLDNSASMPKADSYRSEYLVLVFYTPSQIILDGSGSNPQSQILGSSCSNAKCLFTNSAISGKLGQPMAGTVFYLTTRNTVLTTSEDVTTMSAALQNPLSLILFILAFSRFFN